MKITDFKVLSFDCYGTLIDWERGMIEGVKPLLDRLQQPPSRDQVLEAHAFHESLQQRQTPTKPYREILAVVYQRLAEDLGLSVDWQECLDYGYGVRHWPAFHDASSVLQYLKKHFKLVVLTNVDNDSFAYSNDKLEVDFDSIYTAEDIGSYKPSLSTFEYMLNKESRRGIYKSDILHVAESMYHDHDPANRLGLASCWIHRRHDKPGFGAARKPESMPRYDLHFNSLAAFAKAHQEALRS